MKLLRMLIVIYSDFILYTGTLSRCGGEDDDDGNDDDDDDDDEEEEEEEEEEDNDVE